MKKLLYLLPLLLFSCGIDKNNLSEEDYYIDESFVIVEKSSDDDGDYLTIRTLDQPYMYRVLHTWNSYHGTYRLNNSSYKKYNVGDIVSFDYLLKKEFHSKSEDILVTKKKVPEKEVKDKVIKEDTEDDYEEEELEEKEEKYEHTFTEPDFDL